MRELALVSQLAESPLEVRTNFKLLRIDAHRAPLLGRGMSVHALLLLGTDTILLPVPADRNFGFLVNMEVVTNLASAFLLNPVHTDQLFAFDLVDVVGQRGTDGCKLINAGDVG